MTCRRDTRLCDADEAAALIGAGQTVACGGFIGAAHPEALTSALERRFLATGEPRDLTLVYAAGQGDGQSRGLNHLGHQGLLRRVIGGHWGLAPRLGKLALAGDIEAYNFPQGVICQLYRDIAAGRPGCITHVGLDTFIDPLHGGGRLNAVSTGNLVERVTLGGKTWLWYKAFPIHAGLIRATAADPLGNLVMDDEVIIGEVLAIAQAAHNSGGMVIAQVARLFDQPACPHAVRVPGILVDRIVVAEPHEHEQTFGNPFNAGYVSPPFGVDQSVPSLPLDARGVIAARAADELRPGDIVNLGIGMPEGIAVVAARRGMLDQLTLTVESGPIGGMPAGGLSFGASLHPHAIVDQPAQFDFYDGKGLDFAALGAAQIDRCGHVNVSAFAGRIAGVGGFVNISQNARRLVFCGTFTTDGLKVAIEKGCLHILQEGRVPKFVATVGQRGFSATRARAEGQQVLYVTERAVFRLVDDGIELVEVAPGIDIQKHILDQMDFRPKIGAVVPMASRLFFPGPA